MDYFVNGWGQYREQLPGISCGLCGTAGSPGGFIPHNCPELLKRQVHALKSEGNVPVDIVREFVRKSSDAFLQHGIEPSSVLGGSTFPPLLWEVPSRPTCDFYWVFGPIINARVKDNIDNAGFRGVSFHRVVIESCGLLPSDADFMKELRGAIHRDTREPCRRLPDDAHILRKLPSVTDSTMVKSIEENYSQLEFETVVNTHTFANPEEVRRCPDCGTLHWKETSEYKRALGLMRNRCLMIKKLMPDADIFYSGIHGGIVISEPVFEVLSPLHLTNVDMREVSIVNSL